MDAALLETVSLGHGYICCVKEDYSTTNRTVSHLQKGIKEQESSI